MDGFQLTIVAMAFSDSQWQDDWNAIRLAERRRSEFLGEAEYARCASEAEASADARTSCRAFVWRGVLALRARIDALRKRRDLAEQAGLATVATETT